MKIGQKPELPGALAQAAPAKQQAKAAAQAAGGLAASASSAVAAAGVPVTLSSAAKALEQTSRNQGDFDAS